MSVFPQASAEIWDQASPPIVRGPLAMRYYAGKRGEDPPGARAHAGTEVSTARRTKLGGLELLCGTATWKAVCGGDGMMRLGEAYVRTAVDYPRLIRTRRLCVYSM